MGASSLRHNAATTPGALIALAALIFVSSYACIALTQHFDRVATVWIANAILLAFMMQRRRKDWLKIMAVAYAANVSANLYSGDPVPQAALLTLLNILEVLIVAIPLRLWRLDREFARPKSLIVFYALALGPASIASAVLSASFFTVVGSASFLHAALNWYASDALGLAIFVPPLMTVKPSELREMFGREKIAASLFLIGVVAAVAALNFWGRQYPVAFLFFPAVILITFQRGFAGGAIGLTIAAAYMVSPVLIGDVSAGLRGHTMREQMTVVQIFVAVTGLSVVLVGAALEELKRLTKRLASAIVASETSREEAIVARDAAMQASRSKSMFLANMSHELRTPLNAVIGFADLMHSGVFGPLGDKRYSDYASHIQGAGQHLLELINDILDMSKIEAGKMELEFTDFSVDGKIRDVIELLQERATQGSVELAADLPPGSLTIHGDRRAVRQILLNLLSNAIKFTPEGGRVVTRARIRDNRLVLTVRDTGVGIPADQIERLGNPFVQLRSTAAETHNGTGLGLALVKSLAELHGGTIHIDSTEGVGTTVTVELPTRQSAALAAA